MNRIIWYKVKPLREAKGMSQAVLAEKAGVNRVLLGRIENNNAKEPDYATMLAIANVLGCGILDLVTFFPEQDLNRVTVARIKAGLTKKDLADKAGISLHTVRNIEVYNKMPLKTVRGLIARALEMDAGELWPGVE